METYRFKTNIVCSGCIEAVTPYLNAVNGIEKWEVSIDKPVKILTVDASDVQPGEILEALDKAGYDAILL